MSCSWGSADFHHSTKAASSPTPMDYKEEHEEQAPPQAEDTEIDEEDVLYLGLHDKREKQAYPLIKNCEFIHTWHFDTNLLEKIGMDSEFISIEKLLVGIFLFQLRRKVLASSPSNFFALFIRFPVASHSTLPVLSIFFGRF